MRNWVHGQGVFCVGRKSEIAQSYPCIITHTTPSIATKHTHSHMHPTHIHTTHASTFFNTEHIQASSLSSIPGDIFVDASCGHDSTFLLVTASGLVLWGKTAGPLGMRPNNFVCVSSSFEEHLEEGEKPIKSLGSQAKRAGVFTSKGKVFAWNTNANNPKDLLIIPPIDANTKKPIDIKTVSFGHYNWNAITEKGELYQITLKALPASSTVLAWKTVPETEGLIVVDVDSGSAHSGLITNDGDVYTWGEGLHGCLGHGNYGDVAKPRRVEYCHDEKMKAVKIGCGGYVLRSGGFTLVLFDDNKLYYFGSLGGGSNAVKQPIQITPTSYNNEHIMSLAAGEDWAAIITSSIGHNLIK